MEAKTKLQEVYPLTLMQEGMLFHTLANPDSDAYVEQATFSVEGDLDVALFEAAWARLFARHALLRTVFNHKQAKRPVQIVLNERKMPLAIVDIQGRDEAGQEAALKEFQRADRIRGFDLGRDVLMRTTLLRRGSRQWFLVWSHHHILLDGWCMGILLREFLAIYAALKAGVEPLLPPVAPYGAYVRWLQNQDSGAAKAFWERYLQGVGEFTGLPKRPTEGYEEGMVDFHLAAALSGKLEELARSLQVSLNTVIQCAWGLMLARLNHAEEAVFGAVVSGRQVPVPGVQDMLGLFINTLPVRIPASGSKTFRELATEVQAAAIASERFHHFPLAEIQALARRSGKLFGHLFVFENYPFDPAAMEEAALGFHLEDRDVYERTDYDLNVLVSQADTLHFKFRYNSLAHDPAMVARLQGVLQLILEQVAADPHKPLAGYALATPEDQDTVLHRFNATETTYVQGLTPVDWVLRHANQQSARTALQDAHESITWGEMDAITAAIARQLMGRGVAVGDSVGILLEPGVDLILGVFGIMRAGAAYVPLDPGYPDDRIRFMVQDSACKYVISHAAGRERLASIGVNHAIAVERNHSGEESLPQVPLDALAYVIYTSGSTGLPKGCEVTLRNVLRLATNDRFQYDFGPDDVWILAHSICFDVSVWEIFCGLGYGGTLVIPSRAEVRDADRFHEWVCTHRVTVLNQTPPAFYQFIRQEMRMAEHPLDQHLRYVIFAGDRLECALLQEWASWYDPERVRLVNMYGITEVTVHTTFYRIGDWDIQEGHGVSRVGVPIPGTRVYVLDAGLQQMPIGWEGEFYVAGDGVVAGYLNRPELTQERFLPDPFFPGQRMYKSGDGGRWTEAGCLEVAGRLDDQVKLRGHRIELGEIAEAMKLHPGVLEAFAHAPLSSSGHRELLGYYTVRPSSEVDLGELQALLAKRLPSYMLPAHLVRIDAFPLTSNKKIDRRALPAPKADASLTSATESPATSTEEMLVRIWEADLGLQGVHRSANFFDCGGHSLLVVRLVAAIEKGIGIEVPMLKVFEWPVLKDFAAFLDEARHPGYREVSAPYGRLSPGTKGTVFLFPPAVGLSLAYLGISQQVQDYQIIGFNFIDVPQPALVYARHVQRLQPRGPLTLLGFSSGGSHAFQVARVLEAQGREVRALVLMDCGRRMAPYELDEAGIEAIVSQYMGHPQVESMGLTPKLHQQMAERIRQSAWYVTRKAPLDMGMVGAQVHLVTSRETAGDAQMVQLWQEVTPHPVQVFPGSGPHEEMIFPPFVEPNARLLTQILNGIFQIQPPVPQP